MRDPSCAPRTFGGWTCPDCGAINEASDFTCDCRHPDREGQVNIEVITGDGRTIVLEDFEGNMTDARRLLDRHYPGRRAAIIRID
jgi:hypothetical protein